MQLTERMVQVLKEKDERATKTMKELAEEYAGLEVEDATAAEAQSRRNILYDAIERRMLEELAKVKELSGDDTWRGESAGTFSPQFKIKPVVEDPVTLMAWVRESGREAQLRLMPATLASIVTEALETQYAALLTVSQRAELKPGEPGSGTPPPGVGVFLRETVHHTGPRKSPSDSPTEDGPFTEGEE